MKTSDIEFQPCQRSSCRFTHALFRNCCPLALAAVATGACAASASLETFASPNNDAITGLSSGGTVGVSYNASGIYVLNPDRLATVISPNTPIAGYSGSPGISADGRYVLGGVNGSNGYGQAGIYDRNTSTWTALGDLGTGNYTSIGTGTGTSIYQSSSANQISADGRTVVGSASYGASNSHGVVWRNGQIYDLNAASTDTVNSSRIVTTSADGSVVAGYTNNNDRDSYRVWTWNGSGYTQSAAPTATNPYTGATGQHIAVTALSANGVWGAGDSSRNMGSKNYGGFGNAISFLPATLWNSQTNATIIIPYDHVIDTTNLLSMAGDIDKNMTATIAGVTNDGTVFGSFNGCVDTRCGATLLTADTFVYSVTTGQSITFDSYLQQMGIGLTATQHVTNIYDVAADGSAISGYYFDSATSTTNAFIVHTAISAVPEPGQWALIALGLPLLMLRRLRRRDER
ncbi:MAG TPA: hypothetical protein VGM81_03980 [Burkholderiaceae bacterium]